MIQPKIRFNEFSDEWVEKKLNDVLIDSNEKSSKDNEFDVLSSTVKDIELRHGRTSSSSSMGYKILDIGQLVLSPQNIWMGNINVNFYKKGLVSPSYKVYDFYTDLLIPEYARIVVKQPNMIYQYNNASVQGASIVRKNLDLNSFNNISIQLPTLPEQQKIGALFSKYDAIIALREQKLEELNALKKGMLQQMFDDGATTSHKPQVRFSGFNDEWVEKKLGEITERFDSNRKAVAATKRIKGDIPYYGAVGVQGYIDGYTHDGEYLLIAEDGASSMLDYPVRVTFGKIWVNNHAHVLAGLSNVADNKYLRNKLMTIDMTPYITGGSRHKLTAGDLDTIKIQLPTLPEQQKIGQLFKQLDARISNEQAKIEQLKAQKQGLLQKMIS